MGYEAKVLADSVSPAGVRLATLLVTMPRIVLAEFNTHRALSRNSASSRAIPVEKRIAAVELDPFVPEAFGRNQKGMQAAEVLRDEEGERARARWLYACKSACRHARDLADMGVHKQLANRLIEPFLWHTVVVSATEWSNFFALRCHPDAQPEIRKAAELMREAMAASKPRPINFGEWHTPFVEPAEAHDLLVGGMNQRGVCKVSIGRSARVSYLTHDGQRAPEEDVKLADRLSASGHMSPFEHVARPFDSRIDSPERIDVLGQPFVGNFKGWVQYRKGIPNEDDFGEHLRQSAISDAMRVDRLADLEPLFKVCEEQEIALKEEIDGLRSTHEAHEREVADYEKTVAKLRGDLRDEEARRVSYQRLAAIARRIFDGAHALDLSSSESVAMKLKRDLWSDLVDACKVS